LRNNNKNKMKTQINILRSGVKKQILNSDINYSLLPKATSHVGHSGTNHIDVAAVWQKVIAENPQSINIVIYGVEISLRANWSLSKQSVSYNAAISKEFLKEKFFLTPSKEIPYISIQNATTIIIHNGRNSFIQICPSLVEII